MKRYLCLLACLWPALASAQQTYTNADLVKLEVPGAYTNDESGAFSHCAAGTQYQSGIYFVVTINDKAAWTLGFAHEKWTLTTGQAFPISRPGETPASYPHESPQRVCRRLRGKMRALKPAPGR